ncbi:MAG TPA: fatty acid desaturase [Gemmataceae bacterium]|nr:fatty acid desaturase [Gemmataceae bacterium]
MKSRSHAQRARRWPKLNWAHILWFSFIQAGVVLAPLTFCWSALVVCIILYLLAGLGVTMGYHRLLTHRSFQTSRVVEYLLSVLGLLANQGGPLQWVAVHRVHHQHSDAEGDPHSPGNGVWWAHLLWWMPHVPALDEPRHYRRYVTDLSRDPVHRALQRYHILVPLALAGLLYGLGELWAGVGLSWVIWGIFVRTALLYHATWLVNSATHLWGYRTYQTRDRSTNLWWVALLTLGEGWHNNHHAFPRSARHGLRWWELDLTYGFIRFLSLVSLARHVHVPGKVLRPALVPSRRAGEACTVLPGSMVGNE